MEKRQSMTGEVTSAKERFLKTGQVDRTEDEPTDTLQKVSKPESQKTWKLENLPEDPWGTLTVKLPQSVLNALRIASVKRKAAKQTPHSQQDIVHYLLERWLRE